MSTDPSDQDTPGTESTADTAAGVVRKQSFTVAGLATLEVSLGAGRVDVRFGDEPGVHVEIAHDPSAGSDWEKKLSGMLDWVSDQVDQLRDAWDSTAGAGPWSTGQWSGQWHGKDWGALGAERLRTMRDPGEAVRQCTLEQRGDRIVVRGPEASVLKAMPLAITVQLPTGSSLNVHSGAATVRTTGQAGEVTVESGTGDITMGAAGGTARVRTGSGAVRLGAMPAGIRARSGSGDVEVASIGAASNVLTASGHVRLGVVQADVVARTGAGNLRVDDAAAGRLELVTGSGEIRVGVRSGVAAAVDLISHSGHARSDLPVAAEPPSGEHGTLSIRGRTASGAAVVTTAG